MRRVLLATCVFATTSSPCAAQELGFLTGIFSNVESVSAQLQGAYLTSHDQIVGGRRSCWGADLCGAGAEILFDALGDPAAAHIEVGLGASYLGGIGATESSLDLRGAVRSFPTLSAYAVQERGNIQPYVGLTFGIADIWNAQAYDDQNRRYNIKGQTFEYGLIGGIAFSRLRGLHAEASWRRRLFDGVDWTLPASVTALPAGWPREMDFSTFQLAIGFQVRIKKPEPGRPAAPGAWMLSKVDGLPLPATYRDEMVDGVRRRSDILGGILMISSDSSYALTLHLHRGQLQEGKTVTMDTTFAVTQIGQLGSGKPDSPRRSDAQAVPETHPSPAASAYWSGSELILIDLVTGHRLHFQKAGL